VSKRLDVLTAVCQLVAAALPSVDVLGIDNDAVAPTRLAPAGRAVVRSGDPGEPEMTLGVRSYSYSHRIPIELTGYPSGALSREEVLDAMAAAIGAAVEADRFLGGLVEFLDLEAMTTDDLAVSGAQAARTGDLAIVAEYTTSNPLT
jgi:hypothetical protein